MTVLRPQIFVSYSRRDDERIRELRADLMAAGVECWIDTANIQAGDRLSPAIERAISGSSMTFAYVTRSYLRSKWCMRELRHALASPRVTVAPYADSVETLTEVPSDLTDDIAFGILTARSAPELAGRAWASMQTAQRVVPGADHILAGAAIFDEAGYSRADLIARARKELILAGPNLRSWLSDREAKRDLVRLVKERRVRVTLILTTYECLRPIAAEGAVHLRESAKDIRSMLAELDDEERELMTAHFHVGAATLSAVIVDPTTPEGLLFFSPRWAIQFLPQDRLTGVIDKSVNSAELFKAIYNGVLLMTQGDAKSVEAMLV